MSVILFIKSGIAKYAILVIVKPNPCIDIDFSAGNPPSFPLFPWMDISLYPHAFLQDIPPDLLHRLLPRFTRFKLENFPWSFHGKIAHFIDKCVKLVYHFN